MRPRKLVGSSADSSTNSSLAMNFCQSVPKKRQKGKREKQLECKLQSFLRYAQTQKNQDKNVDILRIKDYSSV